MFDKLCEEKFEIIDNIINKKIYMSIKNCFSLYREQLKFNQSGIGSKGEHRLDIRQDKILWLDKKNENEKEIHHYLNDVREKLNKWCWLSLKDYEAHFALYLPGQGYKKHIDVIKGKENKRKVSMILYLNDNWEDGDGGDLILYTNHGEEKVNPIGGRSVFFQSEELYHEVQPNFKERLSLTCWFLDKEK